MDVDPSIEIWTWSVAVLSFAPFVHPLTMAISHDHLGSSITLVGRRMTDVSSPDQLEYIQKTNFSNYVKGNFQTDMMRDALGFGIFAADGHNWTSSRKTMANIFTANSFNGIITDSVETSLINLDSILKKRSASGVEFDLQALFFAFTLSSFVKLGYVQSCQTPFFFFKIGLSN